MKALMLLALPKFLKMFRNLGKVERLNTVLALRWGRELSLRPHEVILLGHTGLIPVSASAAIAGELNIR